MYAKNSLLNDALQRWRDQLIERDRLKDRQTDRPNHTTDRQSIGQTNSHTDQCIRMSEQFSSYNTLLSNDQNCSCFTPSCGFIRPKLMLLTRYCSIPEEHMMLNLLQNNLVSSYFSAQVFQSSLNRVISNFRNISFAYCGRFSEKVVPNFIV